MDEDKLTEIQTLLFEYNRRFIFSMPETEVDKSNYGR